MLFSEYVLDIQNFLAEFSRSELLVHSELTADMRTEQLGLLKGIVTFTDGSTLFFKEYLDLRHGLDRKMYSFHYQNADAMLRFRYNNAAHKPALGFSEHKHTVTGIIFAVTPALPEVLDEIMSSYLTEI
jgi:hypothetical protein